jgi:hypothetical protein
MHNTSVDIIESRKLALEQGKEAMSMQVGRGKDIISILCWIPSIFLFVSSTDIAIVTANGKADARDKLSDEEVIAQVS